MRGYTQEGLIVETMHRLNILRRRDLLTLPAADLRAHLAHVRNDVQGSYVSDMRPLPDLEKGSLSPSLGGPKKRSVNMMAVFSGIENLRNGKPSDRAVEKSRQILNHPGLPEALYADARRTIEAAGAIK